MTIAAKSRCIKVLNFFASAVVLLIPVLCTTEGNPVQENGKKLYLTKITRTQSAAIVTYAYDTKLRLKLIRKHLLTTDGEPGYYVELFYDEKGRLIKEFGVSSPEEIDSIIYFYKNDRIDSSFSDMYGFVFSSVYTYNTNGQLIKITDVGPQTFSMRNREFSYDTDGNISCLTLYGTDGKRQEYRFTYDDKKVNQYYEFAARCLVSISSPPLAGFARHNITRFEHTFNNPDDTGFVTTEIRYQYTYNSAGYPLTMKRVDTAIDLYDYNFTYSENPEIVP